jgi:NSS family neurotransmitter:Na+ symporter
MVNRNFDAPGRDRWQHRVVFVLAAIGASIGHDNFWSFPYMTQIHGGWQFIVGYLLGLILVGYPMLVLELTLG